MDRKLVQQIRKDMESKSTNELLKIWDKMWEENDSEEAFEAIGQLLIERGETLPPPPKMIEVSKEILGIIEGMSGSRQCDLCFTSNRVIVAKAKSTIGWFLAFGAIGGIVAADSAKKRLEELRKLSAESILKADRKNFEIPYTEITKVEMKKPRALSAGKINIFTHTEKHKFVISGKKKFDADVSLVRSVLSNKLSIL